MQEILPAGGVMLFLLRSAFWLGLTFYAMPWNGDAAAPQSAHGPAAAPSVVETAGRLASEVCTAKPAECLHAARSLTALFAKVAAEGDPSAPLAETGAVFSLNALSALDRLPQWRGATP